MNNEMDKNTEIATAILSQLGGNKFRVMTGARNITVIENGLALKLPKFNGVKVNYLKIELNGNDLYNVTFGRIYNNTFKILNKFDDIFGDGLVDLFEKETGLAARL